MLRIRLQNAGATVPAGQDVLVLWDALVPPDDYPGTWVSLPAEVRTHRVELRERYLLWLRDTGEAEPFISRRGAEDDEDRLARPSRRAIRRAIRQAGRRAGDQTPAPRC